MTFIWQLRLLMLDPTLKLRGELWLFWNATPNVAYTYFFVVDSMILNDMGRFKALKVGTDGTAVAPGEPLHFGDRIV